MLILKNCTAVELQPASVRAGVDILVKQGKIADIRPGLAADFPDITVKDMAGKIVMPGLVCSHNHFYSGLSRGVMAPIPSCPDFISTLKNLWWRLDRALDQESLYYSGLICALEAIRQGCTAVIDHHASPLFIEGSLNTLREAFLKAGLRGMTCYEATDRNGGLKELERGVAENATFAHFISAEKVRDPDSYLVETHIGAHAPFTLPDEGLKLLGGALRDTGRGLHIHVAEDHYDVSHSHHHYGLSPVERLERFGLISDKTLIAHGLWLSDNEIAILTQHDAFLVHNARSNMNNSVGYNAHLAKLKWVALGTDGIGSDMFEELKFAWFKHRDAGGSLGSDSFTGMLQNGNLLLERNFGQRFGHLQPGFTADLTILDYLPPTPLCAENLSGHLLFGINSSHVHSVIIAGRMVYEDRQFPDDVSAHFEQARSEASRMWNKMAELQ